MLLILAFSITAIAASEASVGDVKFETPGEYEVCDEDSGIVLLGKEEYDAGEEILPPIGVINKEDIKSSDDASEYMSSEFGYIFESENKTSFDGHDVVVQTYEKDPMGNPMYAFVVDLDGECVVIFGAVHEHDLNLADNPVAEIIKTLEV